MKKLLQTILIFLILFASSVYATPPCYSFPTLIKDIEDYYGNIYVNEDKCYPSFNFTTPLSYSRINVSYIVYSSSINTDNITEFDTRLRNTITSIENCPGFEEYVKRRGWNIVPTPAYVFMMPEFGTPEDCLKLQVSMNQPAIQKTNNLSLVLFIAIASIALFTVLYIIRKRHKKKGFSNRPSLP